MRVKEGWSQRKLAKELTRAGAKCSQSNVVKIENLAGGTVGFDIVEAAVRLFRLDPDYFFVPGRAELDPEDFEVGKRRAIEERLDALEQRLHDDDSSPGIVRGVGRRR